MCMSVCVSRVHAVNPAKNTKLQPKKVQLCSLTKSTEKYLRVTSDQ